MKEPLIVMGNGPSLSSVNFEILRNRDTFGLNGSFKMYQKLNWYPKYFGMLDDPNTRKWTFQEIQQFFKTNPPIEQVFFYDCEKNQTNDFSPKNTTYLHLISPVLNPGEVVYDKTKFSEPWQFITQQIIHQLLDENGNLDSVYWIGCVAKFIKDSDEKNILTVNGIVKLIKNETLIQEDYLKIPRISLTHTLPRSFDKFIYMGGNAGVIACQIGICLGYKKILLLGIDCNWKKEGNVYKCKDNHWFNNYFPNGEYDVNDFDNHVSFDPVLMHLGAWYDLNAAVKLNELGVEIVNCNLKSNVDCFRFSTLEKEL